MSDLVEISPSEREVVVVASNRKRREPAAKIDTQPGDGEWVVRTGWAGVEG